MNEKEVAELRRRFKPEKSNITHIRGCYVNEQRQIISQFNQSLGMMTQEESEKFLGILKRTLSGGLGKNLLELTFSNQQVIDSEEHKLLMALRDSSLKDEEAVEAFFQKAIQSVDLEGNYLILLAHDTYDVPYRGKDGEVQQDASDQVYSYILCCVCPVKLTKPALSYSVDANEFHNRAADWLVAPPELGFLFPAFDDRSANLYSALYYSRSVTEHQQAFVDAVFHCPLPLPAAEQKEIFQTILAETLADDCSYTLVQAVHDQFCDLIDEHAESREEEPLALSKQEVKQVLAACGIDDSHVATFEEKYDAEFGADVVLSPRNLVDYKQLELRTPDVTIYVNPERGDLVETRIIEGVKYILIRADENVEVNGVNIHINS
ncbi:MAG TPA: DUF4317 domain-containing protein [Firmicutes bacterium]|nr:DUF4317 domain-containing protein [Bacillota bacterium]